MVSRERETLGGETLGEREAGSRLGGAQFSGSRRTKLIFGPENVFIK